MFEFEFPYFPHFDFLERQLWSKKHKIGHKYIPNPTFLIIERVWEEKQCHQTVRFSSFRKNRESRQPHSFRKECMESIKLQHKVTDRQYRRLYRTPSFIPQLKEDAHITSITSLSPACPTTQHYTTSHVHTQVSFRPRIRASWPQWSAAYQLK